MIFYNVKNLYVGNIALVTATSPNQTKIRNLGKYIIFKKIKIKANNSKNLYAKNIFTDEAYLLLSGFPITYTELLNRNAINNYAINFSLPLENFLNNPQNIISEKKILEILNKIQEESSKSILDEISLTILETNNLVKNAQIDEKLKATITKELEALEKCYLDFITNLEKNPQENSHEDKYNFKIECMKKLATIIEKINNPYLPKIYSLEKK